MGFVSSSPTVRTPFEQFLLENFGIFVDLSENPLFAAIAVAVLALPFLFVYWARINGR